VASSACRACVCGQAQSTSTAYQVNIVAMVGLEGFLLAFKHNQLNCLSSIHCRHGWFRMKGLCLHSSTLNFNCLSSTHCRHGWFRMITDLCLQSNIAHLNGILIAEQAFINATDGLN
jgi:hypothetical protein